MKIILLIHVLISILTFPILAKADSINMFKKRLVHLCPEINGRLMDGDKPLSGVTVERGIAYGQMYEETTVTDPNGYFHFSAHEYETRKPLIPLAEIRVIRYLSALVNGKSIKILYAPISTLSSIESINTSFSNMTCDINSDLKTFLVTFGDNNNLSHEVYSICNLAELELKADEQ